MGGLVSKGPSEMDGDTIPLTRKKGSKSWRELICCYNLSSTITYTILLGVFLGMLIPLILHFWAWDDEAIPPYGYCLINPGYRVECLKNDKIGTSGKERSAFKKKCIDSHCCWDDNSPLPFQCYHSFPTAYYYNIGPNNNTSPAQPSRMSNLTMDISCHPGNGHIEILFSNRDNTITIQDNCVNIPGIKLTADRDVNGRLFLQINRTIGAQNEAIFDTRLGPLMFTRQNTFELSTILPTRNILGLGQNFENEVKNYEGINKYGNAELPAFIVFDKASRIHSMLFETNNPFNSTLTNAPGINFLFQKGEVDQFFELKAHIFLGPTPGELSRQIHNYRFIPGVEVYMPPYWALGLHICRSGNVTGSQILDEIIKFERGRKNEIYYDSDCIDSNFRIPFGLNSTFTLNDIENIALYLNNQNRKFFLVQSTPLPRFDYWDREDANIDILIKYNTGTVDNVIAEDFFGQMNKSALVYPDYFHPGFNDWFINEIEKNQELFNTLLSTSGGMVLNDNFPMTDNVDKICKNSSTRIEDGFLSTVKNDKNLRLSNICLETLHNYQGRNSSHFELHNIYGEASMQTALQFYKKHNPENKRKIVSSSSIWIDSYKYGFYNGLEVPFTWDGMAQSLEHYLRNFLFFPFSFGTPICGSWNPNKTLEYDAELCHRWFQLGLTLPFSRSHYNMGNDNRGPLSLIRTYQNYLSRAIQEKYAMNPLYYTLLYEYLYTTFAPIITPLSFYFPEDTVTHSIFDQFMVGPSIMIIPLLRPGHNRFAYFPKGKWYSFYNGELRRNETEGGFSTVDALMNQIPIYIREGQIVPTLLNQSPPPATTESSRFGQYTVIATMPLENGKNSTGSLMVDDGDTIGTVENKQFDLLTFELSPALQIFSWSLNADSYFNDTNKGSISTEIKEIKIFGFSSTETESGQEIFVEWKNNIIDSSYDTENKILTLEDLGLDWTIEKTGTFNWYFGPPPPTASTTIEFGSSASTIIVQDEEN